MTDVDPVTGEEFPSNPSVRRVNRWIERPTLKHCTHAVFTAPGALAMYKSRYPELPAERLKLIGNGYDEEDFAAAERIQTPRPLPGNPMVLVHSGILYPGVRNPGPFFQAISELRRAGHISPANLKVVLRATGSERLYGPQICDLGIEDLVFLAPAIPYRDALVEMLQADGLLIFQAANCNWQIPAKLYECLRTNRPIFALTDRGGDTAAVLASEGIESIAAIDSKEEIAAMLLRFLAELRSGQNHRRSRAEVYSRKARTSELAALLDSACMSGGAVCR